MGALSDLVAMANDMNKIISDKSERYQHFRADVVGRFPKLSNRLSVVAEFVLHNPELVAMNSIVEVAERANVLPATVMRFAKAFSFSGYSEMQAICQEEVLNRLRRFDMSKGEALDSRIVESKEKAILRSVAEVNVRSIAEILSNISAADFALAAKLLGRAETIYVAAKCRSVPLGTYIASELNTIGRRTAWNLGGRPTRSEFHDQEGRASRDLVPPSTG